MQMGYPGMVLCKSGFFDDLQKPRVIPQDIKIGTSGDQVKINIEPLLPFHVFLQPVY